MASTDYEAYLRTPHWRATRVKALKRAGDRCQLCNSSKHLHVHHRTYERLGHEHDMDLTVLCRVCHNTFHESRRLSISTKSSKGDVHWQAVRDYLRTCTVGQLIRSKDVALLTGMNASRAGTRLKHMERIGLVTREGKAWCVTEKAAQGRLPNERKLSNKGAVSGNKSWTVLRPGEGVVAR